MWVKQENFVCLLPPTLADAYKRQKTFRHLYGANVPGVQFRSYKKKMKVKGDSRKSNASS